MNSKTVWWLLTGSMAAGASSLLLKYAVRQKSIKTGKQIIRKSGEWTNMLTSAPETILQTWKDNRKKYLLLAHTLSDEVKSLQSEASNASGHVYKAYLSGIRAITDLKNIKVKTQHILSGTPHSLTHNGEERVKLEEAAHRISALPSS
jgi:hypothetical protein